MVEDEFLHIAQSFTAHLHRAEYDRLKALARAQNAAAISEIERPVVHGPPTVAARRRHENVKRIAKQRRMLQGDAEEGAYLRRESTRAAAGFHSSTLAVPEPLLPKLPSPPRIKLENVPKRTATTTTTTTTSGETPTKTPRTRTFQTPSRSSPKTPYPPSSSAVERVAFAGDSSAVRSARSRNVLSENARGKRRASFLDSDDDDDDPFGLNERRLNRKKTREQTKKTEIKETPKKVNLDAIPSFL
ncbi:hypothetical protein PT974_00929 [Cladobotryum mycophilum]|uniref:Uncharacterized protein n=1 Tax=Cladobotryum mycophilum TaxID=491253 RepID=A0ABR0T294_9HYPO